MPSKLQSKLLEGGAKATSLFWPVAHRVFPETLEIDDNQSYWVTQTPDYQPAPTLTKNITADFAIIGGGFTGTSTAYHFSRRYPEKKVVLLEANTLANGASGRNGGMMLNWLADNPHHNPELMARIYQTTRTGIQMIQDIITRHNLNVSYRTDGTLTVYTDNQRAESAHAEVEHLQSYGIKDEFVDSATLANKLALQGVYGAVLDPFSGQINGAQLVRGLRPVLLEQGVEIYENTPVTQIREGTTITLSTLQGEVSARAILLATNGYTSKLGYFREAIFPVHSHVISVGPLSPEQRQGIGWNEFAAYSDDLDRISYSSMTSDGHIIFGGGSNQSYAYLFNNRTAYPGSPHSAQTAFETIHARMHEYLPHSRPYPIVHRWTGTLGITLNRNTLMGVTGENKNVFYAIGYCGHGVTLANIAGQVITDAYSKDDEKWRGLPFYQPKIQPVPPEPFRWFGYQLFTRLTGRSPRT